MAQELTAPPVLSTPETHILNEGLPDISRSPAEKLSDEQLNTRYEISRTINEINSRKWRRVALQFPDHMLPHSARVYQLLARGLDERKPPANQPTNSHLSTETRLSDLSIHETQPVKLTILGDTSYGSCCVDEVAAEHVDADAVVHYGRACLSPTARLPVLHIYTAMPLDHNDAVKSFREAFPDLAAKVILTADVPYAAHVRPIYNLLQAQGYQNLFPASIVHDPSSAIPNRTLPQSVVEDTASLSEWNLFHISDPPTSLLLTLTSRMASIRVYNTEVNTSTDPSSALETSTRFLLRRRYALITSLTTVPIWGILINTLSVKNYLDVLSHIQRQIAAAGKKSYLFVVGKLNPAKIANFSEIGGWVVIGCWESSLIDSKEFYRPIITPFELDMVLQSDDTRLWTGEWRADFQAVLEDAARREEQARSHRLSGDDDVPESNGIGEADARSDSESESEPPEFDLRTGRYVSRSRPMQKIKPHQISAQSGLNAASSTALTRRTKGDMISVNGVASPAAEYLREKRGWHGLGSNFEVKYEEESDGARVEEGRSGIARGYAVGESARS
ncbi:putative diphthamide synthesis protein-domain-containing protein [Exophiala viscosa]|uniref:putative diphthamide synthesis protein-domain-containing protein n=1 Tax=Exophiala viscosa TaxID=2486360 RepID=UPI00218FF61C|nr:putative diphthamide synthesis protein-domain-containing protein [Exophiala viscosa]